MKAPRIFGGWRYDPHEDFFPEFLERDGCIIRTLGKGDDSTWVHRYSPNRLEPKLGPEKLCCLESGWNRAFFDQPWSGSLYLRWRINLALARATRACWLETLARDFPDRSFSAVVQSGPFAEESDDGGRIIGVDSITAYLYLWTNRPENDPGFLSDMTDSGDLIAGRDYYPERFPAEFVFTKNGAIRQSFLRHLNKDRRDRPAPR